MKYYVVFFLSLCYAFSYLDRQIISLLIEAIRVSFNINDTQIGLLQGAAFSVFYILAGLPLARLVDTGNRKRIIAWCLASWGLMTAGCGMATNYIQLVLTRIGVAVGEAGLPPAAFSIFGDYWDKNRIAQVTSIFMTGPFIGGGAALIVGSILLEHFSTIVDSSGLIFGRFEPWQAVFISVGLPGVVLGVIATYSLREPERRELTNYSQKEIPKNTPTLKEVTNWVFQRGDFFVNYFLGIALLVIVFFAYSAWTPALLIRTYGVSESQVGSAFGPIYLISGLAGSLGGGYICNLIQSRAPLAAVMLVLRTSTLLLIVPASILIIMPSYALALAFIGLLVVLLSAVMALAAVPVQLTVPNRMRARTIALFAIVNGIVGGGLGPLFVGMLSDMQISKDNPLLFALTVISVLSSISAIILLTRACGSSWLKSSYETPTG